MKFDIDTNILNMNKEYKDYYWLTSESRRFMGKDYLGFSNTAEERIDVIADAAENILKIEGFSEKFKRYMTKGWISLSTPIWCNFGIGKGLPISCFGSYIEDSVESILSVQAEVGMMSKIGGGTSAYFGNLRPRGSDISTGGKSFGSVHFMELFKKVTDIISQGSSRRGSCAAYLPIEHADIEEFLRINSTNHIIQDFSFGVTVTDSWYNEMKGGDMAKRKIWKKVIQKRFETGYPYIMFTDTVNDNAPQVYKDKGKKIHASNLCAEIALSSDENESFVCDLSSVNLVHFEEWKDTDLIEVVIQFLDAVMTDFINKAKNIPFMQKAVRFAENQRALGLGVIGYHSFLQSKMIPFESIEAKYWNNLIFRTIDEQSRKATENLAIMFGEPELLKGYGRRNVTCTAIAPTTSSAEIMGESPGIEPWLGCYIVEKLAKGNFTTKNRFFTEILIKHDKNDNKTWKSILTAGGSVQHLEFLSPLEKEVFKTFGEISQFEIILQAGQRQKYIDQSQSVNVKIHPHMPLKDMIKLLDEAHSRGVKSLYYQRGMNPSQELSRNLLKCTSCEG